MRAPRGITPPFVAPASLEPRAVWPNAHVFEVEALIEDFPPHQASGGQSSGIAGLPPDGHFLDWFAPLRRFDSP